MLDRLSLSNFRLFDEEVSIRFRPITVLIGNNSSGKSTILKFLLMLKQSAMSSSENFPLLNGELVRLGDFSDLKNSMSQNDRLDFELSFRPRRFDFFTFMPGVLEEVLAVDSLKTVVSLQGSIPYLGHPLDGEITYLAGERGNLSKHFDLTNQLREDDIFYFEARNQKSREIMRWIHQFIDQGSSDEKPYSQSWIENLPTELAADEIGAEFQRLMNSIFHLPPIRGELSRLVDFSDTTKDSAERRREDSLYLLRQVVKEGRESFQFLSKHLLDVTAVRTIEIEDTPLEKGKVIATHDSTDARVLIADLGFGVSQFLPILVKGATMPVGSCLMVEQPEAQLHPTAQLHLGSFFSELWTQREVGSVIETHSHNLLLRIRRLIAKGDLPHKDVSVAYCTLGGESNDIPIVKNLDINEDGSMEAGLPMEFFAEDIREGLRLGARR
ncbi:MAG: AAA family ATPase [Caldilineaceae bacterium]|nr:AAA family ATPase [Caldilineaceae bacterium]